MTDPSVTNELPTYVTNVIHTEKENRKRTSKVVTPSPDNKRQKQYNDQTNGETSSSDDDSELRAINIENTQEDVILIDPFCQLTEKDAALDERNRYNDAIGNINFDGDTNDERSREEYIANIRKHASLGNISSGILIQLAKIGYTDFEMLGYFRSTESNCFDKLSDVAVLTSHILMKKEGMTDQEEYKNVINHKLTCLLIRDDNNNFRLCTEEKLLSDQVWADFETKYNEFKKIISIDKHYNLPHYDTWKRYMKCYWRIVNWYIENILNKQWFIEKESIEFCKTRLLKQTQTYNELTEKISGFVNSLLVFGVKDNEKGIRTLSNLKGGVTLWLSKCTRKLWKINSGSVDHRYKLIIEENNKIDD